MLQWLPWPDAAAMAAGTGAGGLAARRHLARAWPWAREATLLLGLYAMWQYAGAWSLGRASAATGRGLSIWRAERWLHLPSERWLQSMVLGDRGLLRVANEWYAEVHVPALGVVLLWCFWRHRDRYPALRSAVVLVTGASLLVALWPVAPPRLLPALGVADTGSLVGPSTYAGGAPGIDQLSAMPSLHVGWALLVAGGAVWASSSRWRWVAVAYPCVTVWVVVVTGNHFLADALAAALLCVLAGVVVHVVPGLRGPAAASSAPGSAGSAGSSYTKLRGGSFCGGSAAPDSRGRLHRTPPG